MRLCSIDRARNACQRYFPLSLHFRSCTRTTAKLGCYTSLDKVDLFSLMARRSTFHMSRCDLGEFTKVSMRGLSQRTLFGRGAFEYVFCGRLSEESRIALAFVFWTFFCLKNLSMPSMTVYAHLIMADCNCMLLWCKFRTGRGIACAATSQLQAFPTWLLIC